MQYILLLPREEKEFIMNMLSEDNINTLEGQYHSRHLSQSPQWKEMTRRAEEVIKEEKSCLIHFDDHIQSLK